MSAFYPIIVRSSFVSLSGPAAAAAASLAPEEEAVKQVDLLPVAEVVVHALPSQTEPEVHLLVVHVAVVAAGPAHVGQALQEVHALEVGVIELLTAGREGRGRRRRGVQDIGHAGGSRARHGRGEAGHGERGLHLLARRRRQEHGVDGRIIWSRVCVGACACAEVGGRHATQHGEAVWVWLDTRH